VGQLPEVSEDAVQRAAEVMLRQYDRQYSSGHLTWRNFTDDAREILTAALAPPPGEMEPTERPPFEGKVPDGYELVAVPDPQWRLVSGKRCRRQEAFHQVCTNPAVAEFRRAHGHWWGYCPEHMYGRWVENGRVLRWIVRSRSLAP
jgi:hypothetical protein